MWVLKLIEICCIFAVQFVPIIVDTGVQIWNGVTVNEMVFVKNMEWSGENEEKYTTAPQYYDDYEEQTTAPLYHEEDPINITTLPNSSPIVFNDNRARRDVPCETEDCILRWGMDGGTFDPNEDIQNRSGLSSGLKSKFITIYISENISFDVIYEAIVSIALLQFPAFCLAIFGIFRAFQNHGLSCSALQACLKASLLIFMPFFLVEFFVLFEFEFSQQSLQFVLEKIKTCVQKVFDLLCGQCSEKCLLSFDLLHFLPCKDENKRDKMLCVAVVKVFFGTCIQLCFQTILLLGYTKEENYEVSQVISIISSFLIICKLGVEIIRFRRDVGETAPDDTQATFGEKFKSFLSEKIKTLKTFLFYLPLMFESVVFNVGTLIMTILVWEEYTAIYICIVFGLNFIVSIALPFAFVEQCERKMKIEYKFDILSSSSRDAAQKKVTDQRVLRGIFVSWSNIFFLSRPVEDTSYFRTIHMVLVQIVRFLLNLTTLFVLITYTLEVAPFAEWLKIRLIHGFILLIFMGLLNILLVFLYTYHSNCCGKSRSYEPNKNEDSDAEEMLPLKPLNSVSIVNEHEISTLEESTKEAHANLTDTRDHSEDEDEQTNPNKAEETKLTILDQSTIDIEEKQKETESENEHETDTIEENKKTVEGYTDVNDTKENSEDEDEETNKNKSEETMLTIPDQSVVNDEEKREANDEDNTSRVPKLQRMTSADGSCAIQDNDLEFIGKHSNLANEDVKKHFKGLLNDGLVSKDEFIKLVEMCYPNLDTARLEKHIFKVFDEHKNGLIEFRRFMLVIYALSSGTPEENLKQIFKLVDRNSDGEITVEEFKDVVHDIFLLANERKVSVSIENQLVKKAFSEMDTDADGKVVLDEFIKACNLHNYIVITYIKNFAATYNQH